MRQTPLLVTRTLCLAALIGVAAAALAGCQQYDSNASARGAGGDDAVAAGAGQRRGAGTDKTVAFPTGSRDTSAIVMQATAPEQVRVGQPFQFTVQLTNASDAPLSNVRLHRVDHDPAPATPDAEVRRTGGGAGDLGGEQGREQGGEAAGGEQGQSARRDRPESWDVGVLMPGQTRTVTLDGVAEEVGRLDRCLAVTYEPTICVSTRVVQPNLQLTKRGPSEVLICEPIVYTYRVSNVGTGVAQNVTVRDNLPEGLAGERGQRTLEIPVGDLPAGQTKEVQARVKPARTGEFSSRAVAASESDKAQSAAVTTVVREPKLALSVDGPQWEYLGQPVSYRVTVTNTGDGPARDAVLTFEAPEWAGEVRGRELGVLAPGQSRSFNVTLPATRAGELPLAAAANAFCAEAVSESASVEIRTISALLLETVDNNDPVRIGETTTYQIVVKNQGFGQARDVQLTATLPEGLAFTGATGASEVTAEGQELTFAPLATLAPGAIASWWVEAEAQQPGYVQFEVRLNSSMLPEPAIEQEPTRLYNPEGPAEQPAERPAERPAGRTRPRAGNQQ